MDISSIIKVVLASTLSAPFALSVAAQNAGYTAEQCRELALQHNVKIRNAQNDVAAATETRKEAYTNYFPTVSAMGFGFAANKGTIAMDLQPGVEMSLLKNGVTGGITAMQPVYAGGQIVNGNQLAKIGQEVSTLQLKQSENEVTLTTDQYFWQIVSLQEKRRTITAIDSMLAHLEHDVQTAIKAGVTLRNDLLQVQLKQGELATNAISLDNGISLSKMLLAQYMGVDSTNFSVCAEVPIEALPPSPSSIYTDPTSALPLTPEYKLLHKNVDANRLLYKTTRGKNMPSVAVGAGYIYEYMMDKSRSFGALMATVNIPISSWWGGSHAMKKQKLEIVNAENDLRDNSELLMIRMRKEWNNVTDSYKKLAIAHQNIEQAAENLRLETDYYHAGTITMSDLLEAQSLYQQSRDRYTEAFCNYQTARTSYLVATGR